MAYNGWTNYETWNVSLWLMNEQGLYLDMREVAQNASNVNDLAKDIEEYVDNLRPDLGASMFSDLLGAALSEVNWQEIAEHYWEDFHEEEESEDDEEASE